MDVKSHLHKLEQQLSQAVKILPEVLSVHALNYTLDAFDKERFGNDIWARRKAGQWKDARSQRRGLLINTGALRASNRRQVFDWGFTISNAMPYAEVHNEGFTGRVTQKVDTHKVSSHSRTRKGTRYQVGEYTVQAHTRTINTTIPKRQFIGKNEELMNLLRTKGNALLKKALTV
jgi:phage gpG-like protein